MSNRLAKKMKSSAAMTDYLSFDESCFVSSAELRLWS